MRILVSLAILSFLYGCSRPEPSAQPTAGTLTLLSAIAIPAESATVRLQYGRVTAMNAVQEQDPFCILEVEAVLPEPQTLSPGRFAVNPPRQSQESFSGMPVLLPGMISPRDRALYNEFHALIVRLGKDHCRPKPRCGGCPLRARCPAAS